MNSSQKSYYLQQSSQEVNISRMASKTGGFYVNPEQAKLEHLRSFLGELLLQARLSESPGSPTLNVLRVFRSVHQLFFLLLRQNFRQEQLKGGVVVARSWKGR